MTAPAPQVSVIMATWGRGRHILPSITSALQQDFRDFELIVAGDGCRDDTAGVVAAIADPRLRWINLATRVGSQSGPNNAGIAAAQGEIIAYLGHDDIWEPGHLTALMQGFAAPEAPDFVVSGLIAHPPAGIDRHFVKGIFTDDAAKHRYFFPPSSFAHRKPVLDQIGPWRLPMAIVAPVDEDLLIRAAQADLRFRSTLQVTVHKFTASYRYLSYLAQDSREQAEMLAEIAAPGHAGRLDGWVADARRQGTFMHELRRDFSRFAPGQLARQNAQRRGVVRQVALPLGAGAVLRQRPDFCAFDWADRPFLGMRRHALNPRPKFLLPVTATGGVGLQLRAFHPDPAALGPLRLTCNGLPVLARPTGLRRSIWGWTARYLADITLLPDCGSVLEFLLAPEQMRKLQIGPLARGFGIGTMRLRPLET